MPTIRHTITKRLAVFAAVSSLALGACSDDDTQENATTGSEDAGREPRSDASADAGSETRFDAATHDAGNHAGSDASNDTKTDAARDAGKAPELDASNDDTDASSAAADGGAAGYPGANLKRPIAPAADSACAANANGVQTVERPMFPKRDESPTFGYSFKVYPGSDPSAATVIYVPGGPGSPSIEPTRDDDFLSQVPPELTIIATDPRGVGCNAPSSADYYPAELYNSEYSADDILAIVKKLNLDHYIVYGLSYGTMLSTLVASRAEAQGLPLPKAVLLEGVFGRAFTSDVPSSEVAFQERWKETLAAVPPWQAKFHFESQTKSRRTLVHVDRAGHNPFGVNLVGDGTCLLPLWTAIDSGENFEQAVTACNWPVEIETANAE